MSESLAVTWERLWTGVSWSQENQSTFDVTWGQLLQCFERSWKGHGTAAGVMLVARGLSKAAGQMLHVLLPQILHIECF